MIEYADEMKNYFAPLRLGGINDLTSNHLTNYQ